MEQINRKRIKTDDKTVNIQVNITQNFENTSNKEEVERAYISNEIGKILGNVDDNEKYQVQPFLNNNINKINYSIFLSNGETNILNKYSDIGFVYEDLYYKRKVFTESYIKIEVYDKEDVSNMVDSNLIKSHLDTTDFINVNGNKILKPFNELTNTIKSYNPKKQTNYNNNGFFIYLPKKLIGTKLNPKYLYLKCYFVNAKTGLTHKLGSKSGTSNNNEIKEYQLIKIKTYVDNGIFYYSYVDAGTGNITSENDELTIKLYEIISN